jgi:integrase
MAAKTQFALSTADLPSTLRDGKAVESAGLEGGSMARRRFQKDRIFLRGKKTPVWVRRWREDVIGEDGKVRRVERSEILASKRELPTKRLAERVLEERMGRINSPGYRPVRIGTVEEFSERWTAEVLSQYKPSTVRAAQSHLKNHILPGLGNLRMDEVGNEQQQMFITRLSQKCSRKTVLNVTSTLSTMFKRARKWGYVCDKVDVSELVMPEEEVTIEARFFTPKEVRDIIALAQEPFQTMFSVVAMTGIRAGELLGLQVEDIDFAGRMISIRRSVNRGFVQTVKSKSSRKPVPMPKALADILEKYLRTWQPNADRWLFVNQRNRPFSADKVVMFKLWPILDALKIPHCGLHAFRHTLSSMLLDVGASPQVAQAQLRHSDPRITLAVYSHVIGDSQRSAVEKVADILRPNAPKFENSGEYIQ